METETTSAEETERVGAAVARELRPGDVVLVSGELGAGKTTWVRGALRELGVTDAVTSPTFVVGVLYDGAAHLDLYRLSGLDDEDPGLLDPYFGPALVTFVARRERAPDTVGGREPGRGRGARGPVRRVRLEHAGGDRRRIEVR